MDITLTVPPEVERAVNHILALRRMEGATDDFTVQSYITAELENTLGHIQAVAEQKRLKYVETVFPTLTSTQVANLAEYIYAMLNP